MPVGFGFSVGDFIAGINLLIDSVKSLDEAHGAKADYQELGRELSSLKNALDGIQTFSPGQAQVAQVTAVNTAVDGCRLCVDGFVQRNSKFESLDSTPSKRWSPAAFKKGVLGIRWAIVKKNEVAKFRSDIQRHTHHVLMLLATLELKQRQEAEQRNVEHKNLIEDVGFKQASLAQSIEAQHEQIKAQVEAIGQHQNDALTAQNLTTAQFNANFQSLVTQLDALKTLQESFLGGGTPLQIQMLQILLQGVTHGDNMIKSQQQTLKELQELKTMFKNSQEIPPQVLLSTPVVLLDACGRIAPFHLEFIDSAEALVAVLKIRFKAIGLQKIETGQFALEDTRRKKDLDLTEPWTKVVRPGQHIGMSMIFRLEEAPTTRCPNCGKENQGSNTEDIICADITCRMTYRRIEEIASLRSNEPSLALPELVHTSGQRHESNRQDIFTEDKIEDFTRVRIWTRTAGPVLGASIRGFILSTLNPIRQKRHTLINNSFKHQSGISILQSSTKDKLDK